MPATSAFLRLAVASFLAAGVAMLIGYVPTRALGGPAAVGAMGLGVAIALGASLAGLVPAVLTLRLAPRERVGGTLAAMVLRFVLVLGLLLAGVLSGVAPRLPLAVWTVLAYLVLLAVDTVGMAWLSRRAGGACA